MDEAAGKTPIRVDSPCTRPLLPLVMALKETLYQHERLLTPPLFSTFWQQLAARLEAHLLSRLVLTQRFTCWGAAQFRSHVLGALCPLFTLYARTGAGGEQLGQLREACTLLTMETSAAGELLRVLEEAVGNSMPATKNRNTPTSVSGDCAGRQTSSSGVRKQAACSVRDPIAFLAQHGVHRLLPSEALRIFRQRIWPGEVWVRLTGDQDWF